PRTRASAGPRSGAGARKGVAVKLQCADHVGLRALLALRDLELDPLPLLQRPVPVHLDRAVVDEHVRATVDRDEAVTLLRVEPLDGALSHSKLLAAGPLH